MSAEAIQVRDRIKQVILNFNWGNYGMDELSHSKHDPGAQDWAEHLANAVQVHVGGDLAEAKGELGQVLDLAATAHAAGERVHPGHILDIVGWPVALVPTHCAHWVEGDGPCCRCKAAAWCGDDGATPEAEADYEARKGGCTAVASA